MVVEEGRLRAIGSPGDDEVARPSNLVSLVGRVSRVKFLIDAQLPRF